MAAPNQLLDFLTALKKRRWQVAVPALLIGALGCSFAVIVPKKYLLSTRIEISESRFGGDAQGKGGRETAARREAPSVADHMNFSRVQKVIESQQELWPEYMQAATTEERNQFVGNVQTKQLSASSTDRTNNRGGVVFVDLRFQDEDKDRAARFLEELASSWLEDLGREEKEKLVLERQKLKEIADGLATEVSTTEDSFFKLTKQLGLDPTEVLNPTQRGREDKGDWTFAALDAARTELQHTETSLGTATFDLEQAHKRYDAEPAETVELETAAARDHSDELQERKDKLEQLEEDCKRLRPDNSQYRRKREEIDKLKEQIREFEQPDEPARRERAVPNPRKEEYLATVRKTEDEVARLTTERDALLKRVDQLAQEARARTEQKQELENLRNDYEEARDVLNAKQREWRAKDHELRLLESSPDPWTIVQAPMPSKAGVSPNPWLISAFAVVAGVAAGVGLAVASEFARSSYRTVADLASVMSVPVLGAIETIVTRRERRKRQANRAVAALSTALIVGCIGWVTWMWATAPERLPIEVQAAIERLREALAG